MVSKSLEHASHVPKFVVQISHENEHFLVRYRPFEGLAEQLTFFTSGKTNQKEATDQFFKDYEQHGWDISEYRERIIAELPQCEKFVMARLISLYNHELHSLLPDTDVKVIFHYSSLTFRVSSKARVVDLYMFMHISRYMGGLFDHEVLLYIPNTRTLAPLASSIREFPVLQFRVFKLDDINPMIDAFQKSN